MVAEPGKERSMPPWGRAERTETEREGEERGAACEHERTL